MPADAPSAPLLALDPMSRSTGGSGRLAAQSAAAAALDLRDWLITQGVRCESLESLTQQVGERLARAGVPLTRLNVSVRVLSATEVVRSFVWRPGEVVATRSLLWGGRDREMYEHSPYKTAHETGDWVSLRLSETEDGRYGVVPDLRKEGITHYLVAPLELSNGERSGVTFGTHAPEGFDDVSMTILTDTYPTFAAAIDLVATRIAMSEVLSIYVGTEPARSILDGTVHRGQVKRIRSAIMFVDMKSFTTRSKDLSAEEAADLLNAYYDCVVPTVEAHRGNVLKFMGDGVLAIFPSRDCGPLEACAMAYAAARAVLQNTDERQWRGEPLTSRVALHFGEAAYGNVGSGDRLDFTVVGADVNLASRIAGLGSRLNESLLASRDFVVNVLKTFQRAGSFSVRGFDDPIEVFKL
ncbi:MAG: adenylate/guanylate cyclase domain-containing protein [Hyphomicrobiales bacterium]